MLALLELPQPSLNVLPEPVYLDMRVLLDPGAADHVVDSREAPGYAIEESAGSKAGAGILAANGDSIPNQGRMTLQLNVPSSKRYVLVHSTFKAASIRRRRSLHRGKHL